jgi:LysM domain
MSRTSAWTRRSACVAALLPPVPGLLLVVLARQAWDRRHAFTDISQANGPHRVAAFADLVGAAALVVLTLAAAWLVLALAATLTVECTRADLRGTARLIAHVAPDHLRTLVRLACGVAAVAAAMPSAHASGAGLPAPDRPHTVQQAPAHTPAGRPVDEVHRQAVVDRHRTRTLVVRPGDTLWSIADAHLPSDATEADIAVAWPAWFRRNVGVLGDDPDLILTGTRLTVPNRFIQTTTKGP